MFIFVLVCVVLVAFSIYDLRQAVNRFRLNESPQDAARRWFLEWARDWAENGKG